MMNKYLLGSLVVLACWTGAANAQPTLGTPVSPDGSLGTRYSAYLTDLGSGDGPTEYRPKPAHPILGHLAQSMMTPIRMVRGRHMPQTISDVPSKDEVARMIMDGGYSPAEITAAKIKIDEAQGKARRAAVMYLATIDCHYYPEAESGLIAALRADRVEQVRYEAAVAMGTCRGLTEKMLEALNLSALALELDGNPAESSERVRSAARNSLYRNMARGLCLPPVGDLTNAGLDWLTPDSFAIQQMGYVTPQFVPVPAAVSQREREVAETVSTQPKAKASSRSLLQWLVNSTSSPRTAEKATDPRLRGLAPLGSEISLAIPAASCAPATLPAAPPYNYAQ